MYAHPVSREIPDALGGIRRFYDSEAVKSRVLEYCGRKDRRDVTTWAIGGFGGVRRLAEEDGAPVRCPLPQLRRLLAEGADVTRCLGDDEGNLVLLDIDYVNHGDLQEAYRDPVRCFETLEPLYRSVRDFFRAYGLEPLTIMTGQGYHLVGKIRLGSRAHRALSALGHLGDPLRAKYRRFREERPLAPTAGRVHEAIGRLLEYMGHRVVEDLRGMASVDVALTDAPPSGGGAFACLDLSAYADPLFTRFSRCAYASHQKAPFHGMLSGGLFVCLPRRARSLSTLLRSRRNLGAASELAQEDRVYIPSFEAAGVLRWVEDYRRSRLASFHERFYQGWHDDPALWEQTYDRLDLSTLSPGVAFALRNPNPELLKPYRIREVTLELWRRDWHPRAIAGLIRSKFERDHGWGTYWYRYDAAARADHYVRVLLGERLAMRESLGEARAKHEL